MTKHSPLKDRPLRNPGQSLDEQIRDITYDYLAWPMLFSLIFVLIAAFEWHRYFRPRAAAPLVYSAVAVVGLSFAAYRICKALPRLHALQLGRDGEKAVGQFLESLRERGYRVFHDVVGGNFNLDHVLIGPAGIFTIETKTHSKRSGEVRVTFDGETIRSMALSRIEIRCFRQRRRRAGFASCLPIVQGESSGFEASLFILVGM